MLYLLNGAILLDFLQQGHAKVITGFHKKIAVRFQKEVAAKRTHNIKKGGIGAVSMRLSCLALQEYLISSIAYNTLA